MTLAALKQALMDTKTAERLEANDGGLVRGKNEVYPDPPGRAAGTLDAPWGEEPAPPMTFGTAVVEAAREGRAGMIGRLFTHSDALRKPTVKTASREDETLTETVRRVTGLR